MQNQRDRKVAEDINALILSLNSKASERFKQQIRDYSRKVLSSTLGYGGSDPTLFKNKIIEKVSKKENAKAVIKCQDNLNKFMNLNSNTVQKKGQILKALYKISENNQKSNQLFESMFESKPKQMNTTQATLNRTQPSNHYENNTYIRNQQQNEAIQKIRDRGDKEHNISENQILKEITFSLNNIETQLIVQGKEEYSLHHEVNVSQSTRKIVEDLARVGKLYRNINEIQLQHGVISKALLGGFNEQKNEYLRWLTIIQQMIKANQLNLRKLILWSYQPVQKLKWLNRIMMAVQDFHGSQMISIINCHRPNGDVKANKILNGMLRNLLQPFFQYIYSWVYKGELLDQYQQFFIYQNKSPKSQWYDRFYIKKVMIPNVIDYETAYRIFNAGRTMNFLKNRCKINYLIKQPFFDTKSILQMQDSQSILASSFQKWLKAVDQETNQIMVKVLFQQFKLSLHLDAMKKFFLAGQGQFTQYLADSLKDQLNKPKHNIYQYTLEGYIVDAIKVCFPQSKFLSENARYFRKHITPRLLAKKLDSGTDGWDVFNYQYAVEEPISTLLSAQNMNNYQKIFGFLWRVKKIEQGIKQVWMKHAQNFHNCSKQTKSVFHYCHLIRNSMTHFLKNISSYLMIAIESAWDNFLTSLKDAKNFDQIISIHSSLVNKIVDITMVAPKSKNILIALNRVFLVISNFAGMQIKYHQDLEQYYERVRKYENDRKLMSRGLGLSHLSNEESMISQGNIEVPVFNHGNARKKFQQVAEHYDQSFQEFYQIIKKDNDSLSILIFRLDFNDFYSSNQKDLYEK